MKCKKCDKEIGENVFTHWVAYHVDSLVKEEIPKVLENW